jgi:hypothetical protein
VRQKTTTAGSNSCFVSQPFRSSVTPHSYSFNIYGFPIPCKRRNYLAAQTVVVPALVYCAHRDRVNWRKLDNIASRLDHGPGSNSSFSVDGIFSADLSSSRDVYAAQGYSEVINLPRN